MATEHPVSVVASEFNYIVVFLHGITLGYPTQKLLTFILPLLAKISISCKCHKYRGRKCDVLIFFYFERRENSHPHCFGITETVGMREKYCSFKLLNFHHVEKH